MALLTAAFEVELLLGELGFTAGGFTGDLLNDLLWLELLSLRPWERPTELERAADPDGMGELS